VAPRSVKSARSFLSVRRVSSLPIWCLVVVSFARNGRSKPQSFPRKRESTPQTLRNARSTHWIPAFAGMTGVGWGIRFQIAPLSGVWFL
jgi:hypothetical protein